MSDNILVISQVGCGHCDTIKDYLKWKKKPFKELVLEQDITIDDFWEKYEDIGADGTPLVFVNDKYIYDVIAYYESGLE